MVGGVIIALQIAPAKGAPMAAADFVDAVPEKGLHRETGTSGSYGISGVRR
jgi:hypothetical protein